MLDTHSKCALTCAWLLILSGCVAPGDETADQLRVAPGLEWFLAVFGVV